MIYNYIPVYIQQSSLSEGFFIKMDSSFSNKIDYVKEMYPKAFAKIQSTIEEECDKMDYVGSPMYDEYPDKTRLLGTGIEFLRLFIWKMQPAKMMSHNISRR